MTISLGKISALPEDAFLSVERFPERLRDAVLPFDREVHLDALSSVIDECIARFGTGKTLTQSDSWLAPRLHASLRLTKREAASAAVWTFLATFAFPDYVVWRWGKDRQLALSTTRDVKKHPFKRLWWGAEMFRNGPSYDSVEQAFSRSDVANTSLSTRVMNNRAVALGVLRFIEKHALGSRLVNPLSTQLRTAAVTVVLDNACPNYAESIELDRAWLRTEPLAQDIIDDPTGPEHGAVSEDEIEMAQQALEQVIDLERIRSYRKPHDGTTSQPNGEAEQH
jgi:hypothetical protein